MGQRRPRRRVDPEEEAVVSDKSVQVTRDNALLCLCGGCPVQKPSACSGEKSAALMAAMAVEGADIPGPSELAALYCSGGAATCDDMDTSQTCICMGCPIYRASGLDGWKYCERGSAAEIG